MPVDPQAPETREFVKLLTSCQGVLQSFIVSLMPGHPGSADVLQETNLTLWEKMGEFEAGTHAFCSETTTRRNRMRSLRSSGSVGGVVRP